jgi:DNA methylase
VPRYIGVDSNLTLKEPYEKMTSFLNKDKTNTTKIELYFQDALIVDYTSMVYDMVFTSPPYYNKELYKETDTTWNKKKTEEEWNETFYRPLFMKTWASLQTGGVYCLNVPLHLYEEVCVPLFGEADEAIEMKKYNRILPKKEQKQFNVGQKYTEYIYVWRKI